MGRPAVPDKKVPRSIGATAGQWIRWEKAAAAAGMSVSAWVAAAADSALSASVTGPRARKRRG